MVVITTKNNLYNLEVIRARKLLEGKKPNSQSDLSVLLIPDEDSPLLVQKSLLVQSNCTFSQKKHSIYIGDGIINFGEIKKRRYEEKQG